MTFVRPIEYRVCGQTIKLWLNRSSDDGESLAAGSVTTVTLNTARIIDVVALAAAPVIRTRHVVLASNSLRTIRLRLRLRFGLVATLATIPEVKVQKITLATVPFMVFTVRVTVFPLTLPRPTPTPLPGTRTRSLLLHALLMGLLVRINHRRLQITQLGFDDPRNSLNHIYLGRGGRTRLGKIVLRLNGRLNGLPWGSVRLFVVGRWRHGAVMGRWWITHGLDDHVIFRFRCVSPGGITRIITFRRRVVIGREVVVVGLRVVVEHGHGLVVRVDMPVHLGHVVMGLRRVTAHPAHRVIIAVPLIRRPIHQLT
jgi:hypothetical protein